MTYQILSLCTGTGGLDEAVIASFGGDAEVAYFSEINGDLSQWYQERHPDAVALGDIKQVADAQLASIGIVYPFTIITGGIPCQPWSQAGKGLGKDDPRHLWPDMLRAIRLVRPRYVILENVRGFLQRAAPDVLGDLASVGYDTEWSCVSAEEVGAPHKRERLFVLAWPATDTVGG